MVHSFTWFNEEDPRQHCRGFFGALLHLTAPKMHLTRPGLEK